MELQVVPHDGDEVINHVIETTFQPLVGVVQSVDNLVQDDFDIDELLDDEVAVYTHCEGGNAVSPGKVT